MRTKIIKINPKELKPLEVNARYMKHEEFNKLVSNVKRDGKLTSVPFCCLDDDGRWLILSGNHRVQAAIEAGLEEIQVMVTDDKLSKSQRIGIQLSHNSIAGQDDMAILKELYEAIDDFQYKEYCGLDDKTLELMEQVGREGLSAFSFEYQVLNLMFLPSEMKEIANIIKQAKKEVGKNRTLIARYEDYDRFLDSMDEISSAKNIRNTATVFKAMLDIVEKHKDELKDYWIDTAKEKDYVPISTLTGRTTIKASEGRVVDKAIEYLISKGEVKKDSKESALAVLAQKYLESEGKWKQPVEEKDKNKGKKSKKPIDK